MRRLFIFVTLSMLGCGGDDPLIITAVQVLLLILAMASTIDLPFISR